MAKILVKPLDNKEKWHGKSAKEFPSPAFHLEAYIDPQTNMYDIDLSDERREELSKLGFDLSLKVPLKDAHPFFGTRKGKVILEDSTNVFDTTSPADEIKVAIIRKSPLVAPNREAWESGSCPKALFYIHSEEEDAAIAASRFELKSQAYIKAGKLSEQNMKDLIYILKGETLGNYDRKMLNGIIGQLIEKNPSEFLTYAEMDPKELSIRSTIALAVQKNVLFQKDGSYRFGEISCGFDVNSVYKFFNDPAKSDIYLRLVDRLQLKKATVSEVLPKLKVNNDSKTNDLPLPAEDGEAEL